MPSSAFGSDSCSSTLHHVTFPTKGRPVRLSRIHRPSTLANLCRTPSLAPLLDPSVSLSPLHRPEPDGHSSTLASNLDGSVRQLAWRDIVIALNYQGHLWRLYREYRSENPSSKAPMPCAHFHGPTFHAAARDFRRFAESRARAVEQRREESDSSTQSEGYGSAGSTLSSGFGQEPSGEDESVRLPYVGEVRRESEGGEEQVDERPLPVAVDDCRAVAAR